MCCYTFKVNLPDSVLFFLDTYYTVNSRVYLRYRILQKLACLVKGIARISTLCGQERNISLLFPCSFIMFFNFSSFSSSIWSSTQGSPGYATYCVVILTAQLLNTDFINQLCQIIPTCCTYVCEGVPS